MNISLSITTPSGLLSLNEDPYRLAPGTFETVSVTHRKTSVGNPYVEGTFLVNSLRENVVVPLNVWVEASTQAELDAAKDALTEALEQIVFQAYRTIEGAQELWICEASDYQVTTQREMLHSVRCRVDAQLVRQPIVEVL